MKAAGGARAGTPGEREPRGFPAPTPISSNCCRQSFCKNANPITSFLCLKSFGDSATHRGTRRRPRCKARRDFPVPFGPASVPAPSWASQKGPAPACSRLLTRGGQNSSLCRQTAPLLCECPLPCYLLRATSLLRHPRSASGRGVSSFLATAPQAPPTPAAPNAPFQHFLGCKEALNGVTTPFRLASCPLLIPCLGSARAS